MTARLAFVPVALLASASLGAMPPCAPALSAQVDERSVVVRLEELDAKALDLVRNGFLDEALAAREEALDVARPLGEHHHLYLDALQALAGLLVEHGRIAGAEPYISEIADIRRRVSEPGAPEIEQGILLLAQVRLYLGRYAEARTLLEEVLELQIAGGRASSPEHGLALDRLGQSLHQLGEYSAAERALERARDLREELVGRDDLDFASSLNNLAGVYHAQGRLAEAESAYRDALASLEAAGAEEHPTFPAVLNNVATVLVDQGRLEEAERWHLRTLELRRRTVGEEHPDFALTLSNLAAVYEATGRYSEAAELLGVALEIQRRTLGTDHPTLAFTLNNLASVEVSRGRYSEAEALYVEAAEVRRRALGERHSDYAVSLNNLAHLHMLSGRDPEAETLFRQALAIQADAVGTQHPRYAAAADNLGRIQARRGDYAEAEELHREALRVRREALGEEHPSYGSSLSNLATLLATLGRFDEAEALYRSAADLQLRALGPDHPDYAASLESLGNLLETVGRHDEAEALLRESVDTFSRVAGGRHPDYARSLANLAVLFDATGRSGEALAMQESAIEILRDLLGEDHPSYALALHNLATYLDNTGRTAAASDLYADALVKLRRAHGDGHPQLVHPLGNSAAAEAALGNFDGAHRLLSEALTIQRRNVDMVFAFTSEEEVRSYLQSLPALFEVLTSLALEEGAPADLPGVALEWGLRLRGTVLAGLQRYRTAQDLVEDDPAFRALLTQYRGVRDRISALELSGGDDRGEVEVLRGTRESVESELHQWLTGTLGAEGEGGWEEVTVASVASALPPGSALLEVVRHRRYRFGPPGENRSRWEEHRYLAFVLRPGGDVDLVDLGAATEIDRRVVAFRQALQYPALHWTAGAEADQEAAFLEVSRTLHARLLEPLTESLNGVERLYLVPEGELAAIPWEALVDAGGRYLLERTEVVHVSSGRDLLREPLRPERRGLGTVVFASPDYGAAGEERRELAEGMGVATRGGTRDPRSDLLDLDVRTWEPLAATRTTVDSIAAVLAGQEGFGPIESFVEGAALEEVLKQGVRSPRLLHLATHGYFLERVDGRDELCGPEALQRAARSLGAQWDAGAELRWRRLSCLEDPMLRSGVVLAGANRPPADGVEDGWVTAEELAMVDLRGTELVVLSACETGRGDVRVGEGVYGLRRALELAGARSIVMSLHRIPDTEAEWLTSRFYRLWADDGLGKAEALRRARLEMIASRREAYGAAHPFFWASFVLQGDPD